MVAQQLDDVRTIAPQGLAAVIVPPSLLADTVESLRARHGRLVDTTPGPGVDIVVATARQTKGLEFDTVVLVAPELIVAQSHGVVGDLYVSMTRCTQALRVVSTAAPDDLPAGLTWGPERRH